MLWRWYDVFLFLPVFRVWRIIPVIIRLSQAELLDLRRVQKQISQGFVANIAVDITEVVVIQVINQLQNSIKRGELANFLSLYENQKYVDLNNLDETKEIVKLVSNLMVKEVLPKLELMIIKGGEPFADDNNISILENLFNVNKSCQVSIVTNMSVLKKKHIQVLNKTHFFLYHLMDHI